MQFKQQLVCIALASVPISKNLALYNSLFWTLLKYFWNFVLILEFWCCLKENHYFIYSLLVLLFTGDLNEVVVNLGVHPYNTYVLMGRGSDFGDFAYVRYANKGRRLKICLFTCVLYGWALTCCSVFFNDVSDAFYRL